MTPPAAGLTDPTEWPSILTLGGGLRPPSDGRHAPAGAFLPASPQTRIARAKARARTRGGSAGGGEVEEFAVAVEGELVAGEDGVAEDAVDAGAGVVEDDGDVLEVGVADAERRQAARRTRGEAGEGLQLDRVARRQPPGQPGG